MIDKYSKNYIKSIKQCITDDDLNIIINKIYEDGFEDGLNDKSKSE